MWEPRSQTRHRTCIPCFARQILNHWTTREGPNQHILQVVFLRPLFCVLRLAPSTHLTGRKQTQNGCEMGLHVLSWLRSEPSACNPWSEMLDCIGWSGHFTLTLLLTEMTLLFLDWKCHPLFRKDFLPSSYKEQVVRTKGWVHNDVQASPLCSGFQVVRISHFLPCWQNWNEPPLIHDSPIRALTVSFHCGSDTLRSGSQALELLWVACDKMGLFGYRKNLLYWMFLKVKSESESCSVVSDSLHPPWTV